MAALRPGVIGAIVRKDLITLWPMVLGALLLPLMLGAGSWLELDQQARSLLVTVGAFATILLSVSAIQQDGSTSGRHDWLSRPIGAPNLLAAKFVFLCLTVALPLFAALVIASRAAGHGLAEVMLQALSMLTTGLIIVIPLVVLGLVTGSLIETGAVAFGLAIFALVLGLIFKPVGSDSGARWIIEFVRDGVLLAFCIAAVLLLFRSKNPRAARAAWIAGVLVVIGAAFIPSSVALAVQQAFSPKSAATSTLVTRVAEPCLLPSSPIGSSLAGELVVEQLPQGWRTEIDQVSASYLTRDGKRTPSRKVARYRPIYGVTGWRLLADATLPTERGGSMQWTYALTLLEPTGSRDLPADGRRRFLPGIGYCDAVRSTGRVDVSCFKPFGQPALMTAHVKDRPASVCEGCGRRANYKPSALEGFGGSLTAVAQFYGRKTSMPMNPVVTLTTYEARAHISRRSVTGAPIKAEAVTCPGIG